MKNEYNISKIQAIQTFLMYATDILHEKGVYVYTDDGKFVNFYNSQTKCAKNFGVAASSICRYIKGTRKLKGFVFSRIPL